MGLPDAYAKEKGFFQAEGVDVVLSKEASWASIRDKVAFNLLDGAHMLASLPIAASLGIGTLKTTMQTSFTVSHNGNAITVSNRLYKNLVACADSPEDLRSGQALKTYLKQGNTDQTRLRLAVVYPYSSHNYQLRDWLAQAGIDPDIDVQLIVVPPQQVIDYLQRGEIDGYCVGEPWNSLAVELGLGHILVTGYEIWGSTPEKVFGVNSAWAEKTPEAHIAVIRALAKSCVWVDHPDNQDELLNILSHPDHLNRPAEQLVYGFNTLKPKGDFDWPVEAYQRFSGEEVNRPLPNYALWLLGQMHRWQQLKEIPNLHTFVEQVYRQDLYEQALGLPSSQDNRLEILDDPKAWLDAVAKGEIRFSS